MYLLFKSLHIISLVSWMAGLLYLPRLFAYHCEEKNNSKTYKKFCLMEKRLLKFIMLPAMVSYLVIWNFSLSNKFRGIIFITLVYDKIFFSNSAICFSWISFNM